MRIHSTSRPVIDAAMDKEAKLKAYISGALSAHHGAAPVTLIARATDSPVAVAVAAALAASGRADITLQVVLFDIDVIVEDHATASILDVRGAEFRMLSDARFVSAHEQLVLATDRVWIGDCMRRDPQKRDAFELYHSNDANAAGHAIKSFARIWAAATPLVRAVTRTPAPEVIAAGLAFASRGMPTPRR